MPTDETLIEIVHGRHNSMIDPSLHVWGWEIPVYLFLGGLAGGLLIVAAALELRRGGRPDARAVRLAPFLAVLLLSAGMLALFLDLEQRSRVYRFYLSFEPTSPMSWGSWILLFIYPAAVLLGLGSLAPAERERLLRPCGPIRDSALRVLAFSDAHRRSLLWCGIAAGAGLGAYTGLLLGTLTARPTWNTAILGPLFLVSGLSTGVALLLLFRTGAEEPTLARWDLACIATELFLLLLMLLDLATGSAAHREGVGQLLGGRWTGPFWALVVFTGLLSPMILGVIERKRRLRPTAVAPVLVLIGGLSLRWVLLLAGQTSSYGLMR